MSPTRVRNLDVDQALQELLERAIAPDRAQNPAPGPLPGANLVPPALFQVRDDGNGPVPGEL